MIDAGAPSTSISTPLSTDDLRRYARQLSLPEFGVAGQQRLKDASVLLVGAGGLGSSIGLYLAAAGVGRIGIIDPDRVEESNLQRQVVFVTDDIGKSKAEAAAGRLRALNPALQVEAYNERLDAGNAKTILANYQLTLDACDNFATRYLLSDTSVLLGKPVVYGSIFRFDGQVSVFNYDDGPCYRCLYPQAPAANAVPACSEAGVLGVLPGLIGTLQATEAIKLITGLGRPLSGRLLLYDARGLDFNELRLNKNPDCIACGAKPDLTALEADYTDSFECQADKLEDPGGINHISPIELERRLNSNSSPPLLLDVRETHETQICKLPGSSHIPVGDLAGRCQELDSSREIVVYCKTGGRSSQACQLLTGKGFSQVTNLQGGILAWAKEVDNGMATY